MHIVSEAVRFYEFFLSPNLPDSPFDLIFTSDLIAWGCGESGIPLLAENLTG